MNLNVTTRDWSEKKESRKKEGREGGKKWEKEGRYEEKEGTKKIITQDK